jgi:hypothetical protein
MDTKAKQAAIAIELRALMVELRGRDRASYDAVLVLLRRWRDAVEKKSSKELTKRVG